jgi:hypothetical protein
LFDQKLTLLPTIKSGIMFSDILTQYSIISQWALFLGIAFILFGWLEKKDKVILAGHILFLLLGIFAVWLTQSELMINPESVGGEISKAMKIKSFFNGVVILGAIDLVSLILKQFKLRFQKVSYILVVLYALMLFFMVVNLLKMPS